MPAHSTSHITETDDQTEKNYYTLYTAGAYFLYATFLPGLLTGLNALSCYAPNPHKSLGRLIQAYMTWENSVGDHDIMSAMLSITPASLFVFSLLFIMSTSCTATKPSPREKQQLSEVQCAEYIFNSKMHTLKTNTHALIGSNIPILLIGVFLFSFFAREKDLETASYMSIAAGLGTSIFTVLGYIIYGIGQLFRSNCCSGAPPKMQLPRQMQSTANLTGGSDNDTGHVVIQVQPPVPARGHQRIPSEVVDDVTTRVCERVLRRTASGQMIPGPQRVIERRNIVFANEEAVQTERVEVQGRTDQVRFVPARTQLPGHISSEESIVDNLSPKL